MSVKNRIQFCAGSEQDNKGPELLRCHFGTTLRGVPAAPAPPAAGALRFRAAFPCRHPGPWLFHLGMRCVLEKSSVLYLLLQSWARVPGVSAPFAR